MGQRDRQQFERDDFERVEDVSDADFVLNMFDAADPKAFRRSSRGTSAAFYELPETPDDVLKASYPMLVRTLSNVVLLRIPGDGVWFTTMERGTYHVADDPEAIYERLEPLATSRLVIDNDWHPDLEPDLWGGDEVTADIARPVAASTSSICCPPRFRWRSTSPDAISAMSCASIRWAGFRMETCRRGRTRPAFG